MKKTILSTLILISSIFSMKAQIYGTIKGNSTNDNVGIGTKTPIEKLDINGGTGDGASFDARMALTKVSSTGNVLSAKLVLNDADTNFGNLSFKVKTTPSEWELEEFYTNALTIKGFNAFVGIGTNNPIEKLNINGGTGDGASFDAKMALTKVSSSGNTLAAKIVLSDADTNFGNLSFRVKTTASKWELEDFYTDALTIKGSNANVGIGTTKPDEKLTVNGKIHAQEIRIDLSGPMTKVPDYVFTNDYKLKSLQEVEEFIKQNSHLPEIPSAKEIEKNGLMLAEMNMSLLKKIEELTLYSIAQEKKINSQAQEIEILKDFALRIVKMENELANIKKIKQ
ncbi:tail fiber protein [Flavobacterium sp. N502536]|uniref:tail fiber protein n=1 Tax=Flavobacterium sp. N502536 TaxID=2986837 RepID=UPI0022232849|nr:tail fiber protein [Flavobacterium sp. N502536]